MIVALLALAGEPMGRTRIREYLAACGAALDDETLAATLSALLESGQVTELQYRGLQAAQDATWPAIRASLADGSFACLCTALQEGMPMRRGWDGSLVLRSYRQGVAWLRMALLSGADAKAVVPLLSACSACHEAAYVPPLVDAIGRPFDAGIFGLIHPNLQDMVLAELLHYTQRDPASAAPVRQHAERHIARGSASVALRMAMAEHLVLCGRLDDSRAVLGALDDAAAVFVRGVGDLLRGSDGALAALDKALKALRRETGKRRAIFPGICGHLYVLGLLASTDPAHHKLADAWLDIATRMVHNLDTPASEQLSMLMHIRGGTVDAAVFGSRAWEGALQPFMFRSLIHYWLSLPQLDGKRADIARMIELSEQAGFDFVTAQLASVLGRMGGTGAAMRAVALRQQHRFQDLADWFEREEPWERQLNALINLQPAREQETVRESRLAWMVAYDPNYGVELEPREQKRDAQGGWSRGRALSLKRLAEDSSALDFLTAQDIAAAAAVRANRLYPGGSLRHELDMSRALSALVGHPLLFWADSPGTRVELLPGEPQLLVRAAQGQVSISMQPRIGEGSPDTIVSRETPGRLRVVQVTDEHRRVGAIVGDGLVVPAHAEQRVLRAIGAVSSVVTVQSDIGSSPEDIEQVAADPRIHVHLLPYQHGLRVQMLVRPLPGGGYFQPGEGFESVIADVDGVRKQAVRDLNAEREAQRQVAAACLALEEAEHEHGEWLLGQPLACLELVSQLQELDPALALVAWPQGETFRLARSKGGTSARISVKRDKDWFMADGEVEIAEGKVMDLRALLDAIREGKGRFVEIGDNQFAALSSELHRRLMELVDFGQPHGKGARVHQLASFALEGLAEQPGVRTDKHWRDHVARMRAAETLVPDVPSTLQAELRDYQREGFEWLARLANMGVGACLADDMGLGKTLQALALVLLRAPLGPTLVVAPTSVCTNWMAEAARFAPTLNMKLFGDGDRAAMVRDAQPFDVVVASYGLLQLEAPLFVARRWTTIVLDEAQAIKNSQTRRAKAVMALDGEFRMAATGTPLENHLGELWALFSFINPGLLGTADQFGTRFSGPIERANDKKAAASARARLRRLVQPFILRRTKAQVLSELPPRTEIVLPVELTAEEAALYEALRREAVERLAAMEAPGQQKSIAILAEMMRLRRACCNPELVAPGSGIASSKLTVFSRLLAELLENRHKVLVFSQFVDHLSLVRAHLDANGVRYQYLDGATPMKQRKERVDAFQSGDGDVFLISLKAGGVGINLTAADYVVHLDPWWNPAVEDQASDRAHRMGQLRPVTIYRLVARNTIEEGIVELHAHKRDLADSLLEGTDAAARLSPQEMLRMLEEGLAAGRADRLGS